MVKIQPRSVPVDAAGLLAPYCGPAIGQIVNWHGHLRHLDDTCSASLMRYIQRDDYTIVDHSILTASL